MDAQAGLASPKDRGSHGEAHIASTICLICTVENAHFSIWAAARKNLSRVFDKVRLKPVFSATETSLKIEISSVASLHMILPKKQITKALIRLRRYVQSGLLPCCSQTPEDRFSHVEARIIVTLNSFLSSLHKKAL